MWFLRPLKRTDTDWPRFLNTGRLLVTHLRGHDCATPGVIVYEKKRTPAGGCENRTIDLVRLSM